MAVQFESIGALGPLLKAQGINLSQLGLLIGLYLRPESFWLSRAG
jgi:hypothetical protein